MEIDTETAREYEYDPKDKKKNKFNIYENDLKYSKHRSLIPKNITGYDNINRDSFEYRLNECKMGGYKDLDLSHMDLKSIPNLHSNFYKSVENLFLSENKLSSLSDIKLFENVKVIDLSNKFSGFKSRCATLY